MDTITLLTITPAMTDWMIRRLRRAVRRRVSDRLGATGSVSVEMVVIGVALLAAAILVTVAISNAVQRRVNNIR